MRRRSLRYSITLSLLLFVIVSCGVFALAVFYVNGRMEQSLFDDTLDQEYEEFQQTLREEGRLDLPHSSHMHSYLVASDRDPKLPGSLRGLGTGQHHDIPVGGRYFHVLHQRVQDNQHLYLALDISKHERRETRLAIFLVFGIILVSAIAVWVGYLLSRRLVAPVAKLAGRVSRIEPGEAQEPLSRDFAGAEVEVIAQSFDRFLQRLEDFVEREHAFVRDSSHELRTPLAVITSASELLLADPGLPEGLRPPLQRIGRASRQMNRLTRALLLLAREAGSRAEPRETCRAGEVIAQVVEDCRQLHPERSVKVHLEVDAPLELSTPPELLEIVVTNLLQNALAHTARGAINVRLRQGVLTVEDSGRGISADDLPKIFDRDYRGSESRGIGRGLDLVRRICARMGWRIEVASELNWGTRFDLHLLPAQNP